MGEPPKNGWFLLGKIPSFEIDDDKRGSPILGNPIDS